MILKGEKRKLPPDDEEGGGGGPGWESQRQLVLSLSFTKYQHSQELAEPSLRRQVLIANTLRRVSAQVCAARSQPPPTAALRLQEKDGSGSGGVGPPQAVDRVPRGSSGSDDEDWASMSAEPDFEVTAAVASILTALDSPVDGGLQAPLRPPLRSLENLLEPGWEKAGVQTYGEMWEHEESSMEVMRFGSLGDVTVEELFHDIDTSLLESDVEVLGVRSGGSHPAGEDLLRFLPPFLPSSTSDSFSISFNPGLMCLPSIASFSQAFPSSFAPPPLPPPFSTQSHTRDGLDLDHLMEVLVKS